jgi:protein tyrosine phosphatase (PTP) superfamily phosphohydrolase (DUF442 family)
MKQMIWKSYWQLIQIGFQSHSISLGRKNISSQNASKVSPEVLLSGALCNCSDALTANRLALVTPTNSEQPGKKDVNMLTTIERTTSLLVAAALSTASFFMTPSAVQAQSVAPIINNEILAKNSIKNFQQIDGGVLRGSQPGDKNLKILADCGVKTIIDLRQPGKLVDHESVEAKKLGLEYVHIPLGFRSPDQATMTRILSLVNDKQKQPVFVHCRQGADRTGMTVGMYRVLHDNWDFRRTYDEMRKHHFKPVLLGMKEAVRNCQLNAALVSAINPSVKPTLKASERANTAAIRMD